MKNNVKMLRAWKGLTQEELGKAIGISRQSVAALESDKFDCSMRVARNIADFFGCCTDDIFVNDDEEIRFPKLTK